MSQVWHLDAALSTEVSCRHASMETTSTPSASYHSVWHDLCLLSAHFSCFHVDQPAEVLLVFAAVSVWESLLSAGEAEAGWVVGLLLLQLRSAEFLRLWEVSTFTFSSVVLDSSDLESVFGATTMQMSMQFVTQQATEYTYLNLKHNVISYTLCQCGDR